MQTHYQDMYSNDLRLYDKNTPQKYCGSSKEDINNSDMSVDFSNSDQLQGPNLKVPLQTENGEVRGLLVDFNIHLNGDQNLDLANWSTQSSSLTSTHILEKEEITAPSCWGENSFSAKFSAPVKSSNRSHYKNLLKDFNRKEFSGRELLAKFNQCVEEETWTDLVPENDEEMTLEDHLKELSTQYNSNRRKIYQREAGSFEDLHMKIVQKSYFGKGQKIILQSRKRYYQKIKKENTNISISFTSLAGQKEFEKYITILKEQGESSLTCCQFFKMFSSKLCENGLNMTVKVNEEPLFPAKATLNYLWNLYKDSQALVILA